MRAFARNASSRDELKDEENPAPTTPVDYSGTTPGSNLKGRPTARFSSIELIQRDFDNESPTTKSLYAATGVHSDLSARRRGAHSHPLRTQAFPKKIQEEYDRLADEQMQKLKERVDPRGIRTPSTRREREHTGSRAGTPCFPRTDAKRVKTPAPPLCALRGEY